MVDGIWSLQYMAAGPICGSAGPLSDFRCSRAATCEPFTHAVLFRYSNAATRQRFESQPRVHLMLGGTGAPQGTGACRCSLFRSGRALHAMCSMTVGPCCCAMLPYRYTTCQACWCTVRKNSTSSCQGALRMTEANHRGYAALPLTDFIDPHYVCL